MQQTATDTRCCSVTATPGTALYEQRLVCDSHAAEGWQVVNTPRWGPRVDRAEPWPCGCVVTTLEQVRLSQCATHIVGPMACCPSATRLACVCVYAYRCPTHGRQHYGSHD